MSSTFFLATEVDTLQKDMIMLRNDLNNANREIEGLRNDASQAYKNLFNDSKTCFEKMF